MKTTVIAGRIAFLSLLVLCMGILTGCAGGNKDIASVQEETAKEEAAEEKEEAGVLLLRVNPEIAIEYDGEGKVTKVRGLNADGENIIAGYRGYEGKECREVVSELVGLINEAGYFVEEVEGRSRKITIEIEAGSVEPEPDFLEQIAADVQRYVEDMQVNGAVSLDGETDFDIYDYGESAYDIQIPPADKDTQTGSGNESQKPVTSQPPQSSRPDTNYDSPYTDYNSPNTDYNDPHTDYQTDYHRTDYESDYGKSAYDSRSDYTNYSDYD